MVANIVIEHDRHYCHSPKDGRQSGQHWFPHTCFRCGGDVCSWFVGELFAAPLRWGFVTLGWCGLFAAARELDVESGGRDLEQRAKEHPGSVPGPGAGRQERVLGSGLIL